MDVKNTIKGRARQGAAVIGVGAVLAGAGAVGLTAVAVAASETSSPTSASTSSSATSSEPSTSSSASSSQSSTSNSESSTSQSTTSEPSIVPTASTTPTEEPTSQLSRPFYDTLVGKGVDESKADVLAELESVICGDIDSEACAAALFAEDGLIDDIVAAADDGEPAVLEVLQEAGFGGHTPPGNDDDDDDTGGDDTGDDNDGDGDDDAGNDDDKGGGNDAGDDAGNGGGNGNDGADEDQTRTETRTETQTRESTVTVERNTTRTAEPQTLTQRERIIERRTVDREPEARDDDRDELDADAIREAIARDRADRAARVENPNARSTAEPRDSERVVGRTTTERADAEKEPPLVYADASDEDGTGFPVWGWGLLGALLAGIAGASYMVYESFKKGGAAAAAGRGRPGAGRGSKSLPGSVKKPPSTRK